jgi:KAP family P-loop domain
MASEPIAQVSQPRATVIIETEGLDPLSIVSTGELHQLFAHASHINEISSEHFDLSFTSLLIALYCGPHGLSQWFRHYVLTDKVDIAAPLKRHGFSEKDLPEFIGFAEFSQSKLEKVDYTATRSAREWLNGAHAIAIRQGHDWTGLRHMMAAVITLDNLHSQDLTSWGFFPQQWGQSFLAFVQRSLPGDLAFFRQLIDEASKHVGPFSLERPASAHIASDSWTVDDSLGHREYARALYRFVTDEKTAAPLAVSIQAPWGGGKTSLMRMVQQELDPQALVMIQSARNKSPASAANLPESVRPGQLKPELGEHSLRIRGVLDEIRTWKQSGKAGAEVKNPTVPSSVAPEGKSAQPHRITVWFNAWKYQTTEQVWAGLADCILRQVTERMNVRQRQRFWLQLQLGRIDTDKIQQRIYSKIISGWWHAARPWIFTALGAVSVAAVAPLTHIKALNIGGAVGTTAAIVALTRSLQLYFQKRKEVEKEPAELTLADYLQIPDYRSKIGFIHDVAEDLRRAIKAIPPNLLPIVVFIDDLDRCSPQKVAEVTEGINLFLAGEFPDCLFIFGMDAEIVAAALQKAHSDVIHELPAYASGIPVGWRFMDKFVQLPFVIPPPEPEDVKRYVKSLLNKDGVVTLPTNIKESLAEASKPQPAGEADKLADHVERQLNDPNLRPAQIREARLRVEQARRLAQIDVEIANASRDNEIVSDFLLKVAPDLYSNPRDLKRFLNTFRLHDFLRIARLGKNLDAPSRSLIADWIRLSLRWPQVVRWMHRANAGDSTTKTDRAAHGSTYHHLTNLEAIAVEVASGGTIKWNELVVAQLGATLSGVDWVSDPALFEFFREVGQRDLKERLSYGAGKGLW